MNISPFTVLASCGGLLNESSGEISSPRLPRPLPNDVECNWKIRVPRAQHVNINVMVAWRRYEKCSNYLLIKYTSEDRTNTVKICGREDVRGIISINSNNIRIKYHVEVGAACNHSCNEAINMTRYFKLTYSEKIPPSFLKLCWVHITE